MQCALTESTILIREGISLRCKAAGLCLVMGSGISCRKAMACTKWTQLEFETTDARRIVFQLGGGTSVQELPLEDMVLVRSRSCRTDWRAFVLLTITRSASEFVKQVSSPFSRLWLAAMVIRWEFERLP